MQRMIGAMILGIGLGLASVSNAVATPVGVQARKAGLSQHLIQDAQYWRGGYCERLRRPASTKKRDES